ncbi:hypothetical protein FF38_13324 [Lucilia cuprina]|uniref:Uncharacterized protein n=1 Tax=Lucilia cuprina TaxID=7375 RepID=A0A0L0BTN5_LUCCU|nr:hypothetical protein FF38_13324 [Lucilia cuprina]
MPKSLRREIARKKREYLKRVMKSTESQNDINESENLSTIDDGIDQSSKLTVENNIPPKQDLNTQLKNVFLNHHVTRQLGDDILKVLCENGIDVPSTSKKLLKKKQTPFIVRTVNPDRLPDKHLNILPKQQQQQQGTAQSFINDRCRHHHNHFHNIISDNNEDNDDDDHKQTQHHYSTILLNKTKQLEEDKELNID